MVGRSDERRPEILLVRLVGANRIGDWLVRTRPLDGLGIECETFVTHRRESRMPTIEDDLKPARGVVIGLVVGALMWIGILAFILSR
jgi:hypothetical protein